jgi:two-component system, NtrC family, response regulator PilR
MSTADTPQSARILVVDDEPDLRTLYELTLLREGYQVDTAVDLAQARSFLSGQPYDVLITDMRLPDGLGLDLLGELVLSQRHERCIVITAYGSAENAVTALKSGAFDYLTKPVDLKQFRAVVASAVQQPEARAPAVAGRLGSGRSSAQVASGAQAGGRAATLAEPEALQSLVGSSAVMRSVKSRIAKVARSMAPVLILGESGTGKELVARAVHGCSHRSEGPFVAVNCGAIPENLLEAEFFGAKKGSYTGATAEREGFFQAARGGTLFLDEIGDLPLIMQTKLLRAIQERSVRPLGSTQEEAVDVRVLSATHKDLNQEVGGGRFRQDLYYRLHVIEVLVPPLRERREDLPELCQALLARIAAESGLETPRLSASAQAQLSVLPLVGNVRELENLLHRAVAMSEGEELDLDLPAGMAAEAADLAKLPGGAFSAAMPSTGVPSDLQTYLDAQEREILVQALKACNYNRTAAAAKLGLNLRQIRYRIARLQIDFPGDAASGDDAAA